MNRRHHRGPPVIVKWTFVSVYPRMGDLGMATFFSQTSEYALRVMAWMAARRSQEPILARDLAIATEVPLQYLTKILRRLVLAGLLQSRRGRGGGFTLARPATEIRFRDVLVAMNSYPTKGQCAFGWERCDARRPCPLHGLWSELHEGFHAWASNTSIAGARVTAGHSRSRRGGGGPGLRRRRRRAG